MNALQISKLVDAEVRRISQIDLVHVIQELRVEPREELRDWDYGKPGERYPCWIVIEQPQTNTSLAYCEQGFGPSSPWGLLFITGPYLSIGMDAGWFVTLEDAMRQSQCWDGENPAGYEVR